VANAAYAASRRTPPAAYSSSNLTAAADAATKLRNQLFNRGVIQNISHETIDAIQGNH
jgi:hypothetical protein